MTEDGSPAPQPTPDRRGSNFWSRRSKRGKILIALAALFLLFAAIGVLGDPPDERQDAAATEAAETADPLATTDAAAEEEPATTEEAAAPPPPPPPKAPAPITLKGVGARVETLTISQDSPAIFGAVHRGSSNFIVELVGGGGSELLINDIGNYSGEVAYADAAQGRYRLRVEADGPWTINVTQPVPTSSARVVPDTFEGNGPDVLRIRAEDDLQPIVESRHSGQSNFVVYLIGYGDLSGQELVVNEIGNYSGQTIVDNMPAGPYLLAVQADGP